MRENRKSGSEGGEAQTNELSLPLSAKLFIDGGQRLLQKASPVAEIKNAYFDRFSRKDAPTILRGASPDYS